MRNWILVGVASAALLAGCGNKEAKLMGTWKADVKTGTGDATLELKADHKFAIGGLMPMAGTWKFADDKLTLMIEQIANKPVKEIVDQLKQFKMTTQAEGIEKGIEGKPSEDFTTLTITNPGGQTVSFKKV